MNRSILFALILVITLVSRLPAQSFSGTTTNGLRYTSDGTNVTITGPKSISGDVVIPETIGGKPVTTITGGAFYNNYGDLRSIVIPNSVTVIGESAFGYCYGLTNITIPSGVTSIGGYAFYQCSGLTSIIIPSGVTSIGESVFYGCSGLTNITIPNSITSIGDSAFYACGGLTNITIPNSVTSIGRRAFYYCTRLTSITIPDSVTTFGLEVFQGCGFPTTFIASAEMKAFLSQNSTALGIAQLIVPVGESVTTQQLIDLLQGSFTNTLFNSITGAASTNAAFVSAIANQFIAPGSPYGIAPLSYLTNPLYLGTVASNTAFVGSLTAQIVSTPGNYGLATKADLSSPAVLASMATNATFLNALASNPVFLNALTRQISAGSATNGILTQSSSAGATFAASLATNTGFLNALTQQISTSTSNFGIYVKQPQSLSFPAIAPSTYGSTKAIKLAAVSSAGLSPITFISANPSVATISNGNLSVVGAGSTTITASQAGSLSVAPVSVSQPFVVFQLPQTLKFTAIPAQTYVSGKTLTLSTTSSAKLTPTYTSSNEGVATVSNNILTFVGPGTTIITATQQGDANIAPAAPVFQMLTVK